MGGYRAERIAELIHKELAQRLRLEVKDPELTDISITHVEVSGDLSIAQVFWVPLGGGEPSDSLVEAVERASFKLRGPIGRALRLRTAPELRFEFDRHIEQAFRVNELLDQVGRELRAKEEGEE